MLEKKDTVVVYKSKYGSTKYYADWIAKSINADLLEVLEVKIEELEKYKTIVYGGPLFAFKISGVKLITQNLKKLKDKKIIIFTTGILSETEKNRNSVIEQNFTKDLKSQIKLFMLKGDFDIKKLNLLDKIMINTIKRKLKKMHKDKLDENMKELLKIFDQEKEETKKDSIQSIVECVNEEKEGDFY
ncbi:MAG: hypothetical protein KBF12_08330 [Sebaldella sp.]|nr:hypothetical protein [Sebaldella sp.]